MLRARNRVIKLPMLDNDSLLSIAPLLLISEVVDVPPPNALLGNCFLSSSLYLLQSYVSEDQKYCFGSFRVLLYMWKMLSFGKFFYIDGNTKFF